MKPKAKAARKFKSKWTKSADGTNHPSAGEAKYWDRLKMLERAGEIRALELKPRYKLFILKDCPTCRDHGEYVGAIEADAGYDDKHGVRHIVDWKEYEGDTPLSRFKRRIAEIAFGVVIELVGPEAERAARRKGLDELKKRALPERGKS